MSKPNFNSNAYAWFLLLVAIGVGVTLVTGLVHGRLTQRWGPVPDLQVAARHLENFPSDIGDWQLIRENPITATTQRMLSCAGYVNREYVNRQSGQTVSIAIVVGPAGPTAVHTPEICYSSRAYSIQRPRQRVTLSDGGGQMHSFWSVLFQANDPSIDQLHVCYAWRAQEQWNASESPRFEFAGQRFLFKLQIASVVSTRASDNAQDPCQEFLSVLLRSGWNNNVEDQ